MSSHPHFARGNKTTTAACRSHLLTVSAAALVLAALTVAGCSKPSRVTLCTETQAVEAKK